MFWLMEQLERFYKQALPRGMTQSDRAKYRKSFKEACALRIFQRSVSLMMEMTRNEQTAQASTGSTALVVKDHFKRLDEENEEVMVSQYPNLRQSKAMKFTYGSGTSDGQRAGDRVQLRKEIQ